MNDRDLVRACLDGRAGAWEALLERHGEYLRVLVSRRFPGDPEDILQDLWATLLEDGSRRLRNFDPSRPLRPYLAAVVLNLCRKRRGRELPAVALSAGPASGTSPLDGMLVREALDRLDPRERLALVLAEADGWSYAEIARLLRIGPGGVGALLTRARRKAAGNPEKP